MADMRLRTTEGPKHCIFFCKTRFKTSKLSARQQYIHVTTADKSAKFKPIKQTTVLFLYNIVVSQGLHFLENNCIVV